MTGDKIEEMEIEDRLSLSSSQEDPSELNEDCCIVFFSYKATTKTLLHWVDSLG